MAQEVIKHPIPPPPPPISSPEIDADSTPTSLPLQQQQLPQQQQPIPSRTAAPRIVYGSLVNRIVKLSEQEFWKLVSIRLNTPTLTKNQIEEEDKIPNTKTREFWTEDCLIEKIFLRLAGTKILVKHDGKDVTVFKYYSQALRLRYWIPVFKPTPQFIVNRSDLTPRIMAELKSLGVNDASVIFKQAVGWIFRNIDSRQYHLSIARNLEVVLKP